MSTLTKPIHLGPATVKSGAPSEGRIQDEIRKALGREPDLFLFRNNISTAKMPDGSHVRLGVGGVGAADLIGAFRGRFVAAEIKRPGEKLRPEQARWRDALVRRGCEHVVLTSVEEAMEWLEGLRRKYA